MDMDNFRLTVKSGVMCLAGVVDHGIHRRPAGGNDDAESNAPALGYTGAYAFANVILTLAGTLIMLA